MKFIILCLFLFPVVAIAQTKSYSSAEVGIDLLKNHEVGYNIRLHGGLNLEENVFIGIGGGVSKLTGTSGIVVPVFVNIGFAYEPENKIFPIVSLQPGYNFYALETTVS